MLIRQLPEDLILKMAAGEVVERPASVVKELVENSVDAGAGKIEVSVVRAGLELISVVDDGCGIRPSDLRAALGRHATSKIATEDDLFNIATLGFRGEALASIAAISRLEIVSRTSGSGMGARIESTGGVISGEGESGAPLGTQVSIRDIFFNTPARRKFLKTPQTELARIVESITRIALGFPQVRFSLSSGERRLLDCPPADSLEERTIQVLGGQLAGNVFKTESAEGGYTIEMVCAVPSVTRSDMSSIYTFVNGRHVLDRGLRRIVTDAFRNVIPAGRFPVAVVSLVVPGMDVDVNVHPQKSEVRFSSAGAVYGFVSKSMAGALAGAPWLTGRKYELRSHAGSLPRIPVAENAPAGNGAVFGPSHGEGLAASPETYYSVPPRQMSLHPEERGFFSSLIFRGQFWEMYLAFEGPESIFLVDQHAAHERVAFSRLIRSFNESRAVSQMFLVPAEVELSPAHAALIEAHAATLDAMGLQLEPFGPSTFLVRGIPEAITGADPKILLADIVDELDSLCRERSLNELVAKVASRMACHAVVRGRHILTPSEAEALARQIDAVDFGTSCPHGRPVYFEIMKSEVEKRFGRK
jgi:DNA mismatch repair protein MutL